MKWACLDLLCAAGLSFIAVAANGKSIYVAPGGNDSNSGASTSAPLRTIASASSKAVAGDIVILMPGQYQESIVPARSGASGNPITYRAQTRGQAVITRATADGGSAFALVNVANIVIDGISANGGQKGPSATINHFAMVEKSTQIVVRNGVFKYANGWGGFSVYNSSYFTLEDSEVDWLGQYDNGDTGNSDYGDMIEVSADSHHVLIQRNTVRHAGHDLFGIYSKYSVIQDNYFDNSFRDALGGDAGGRGGTVSGSFNIFQRNVVTGSGASSDAPVNALMKIEGTQNIARQNVLTTGIDEGMMSEAGEWTRWGTELGRIYQNTFHRLGANAWRLRYFEGGYAVGRYVFSNNLVVDSRVAPRAATADFDVRFLVGVAGKGATAESKVLNNIFSPSAAKEARVDLYGFNDAITLKSAESLYPSFFAANLSVRPQFVSTNPTKLGDFDLKAGSRGIDEAMFLTKVVGAGRSTTIRVQDSRFFSDGNGIVAGDVVQLEGATDRARISSIDHASGTITLATALQFRDGQGMALAFEGSKPDIGAREYGAADISAPRSPSSISIE